MGDVPDGIKQTAGGAQGRRIKSWNGSRCEPSRRAERRAGAGQNARSCLSCRPLCAGWFGRSATKPTTLVSLDLSILMRLPCGEAHAASMLPLP